MVCRVRGARHILHDNQLLRRDSVATVVRMHRNEMVVWKLKTMWKQIFSEFIAIVWPRMRHTTIRMRNGGGKNQTDYCFFPPQMLTGTLDRRELPELWHST